MHRQDLAESDAFDLPGEQFFCNRPRVPIRPHVHPFHRQAIPEPRHLAAGELPGLRPDKLNRLIQSALAAQVFHHLPVTDGLHCRAVLFEAAGQQRFRFRGRVPLSILEFGINTPNGSDYRWAEEGFTTSRARGRLMSIFNFDPGPINFFARISASVNRAIRISPSVDRFRS